MDPNAHERDAYLKATESGSLQDGRKTTAEEAAAETDRQILTRAMDRWHIITENPDEKKQRAQELEDLQFDRGRVEDHWPKAIFDSRQQQTIGDVQVNPRPCLVVNKLAVPVQQVENEGRSARLEPVVKAKPGAGNEKTAEIKQGLLRNISVQSDAQAARHWAYGRAVRCGRGYYRVDIGYQNDGDFDLDIMVLLIKNQGSLYLDPFHVMPDGSDATYAFQTEEFPVDEAPRRFKALKTIVDAKAAGSGEFTSLTDREKAWFTPKGTVRVAEYWEVDESPAWRVEGVAQVFDAMPDSDFLKRAKLVGERPPRMREITQRKVNWYLIGPGTIIARSSWAGRYIPIVQVIGRMTNVDGEVSYKGVITDAKDSQRIYNFGVSTNVENVALMPRAPYIAAIGQLEKYKAIWAKANQLAFAYLPYDPVTVGPNLAPPPARNNVSPDLSGAQMLINQADADIKATTGRYDPSLGAQNQQDRSGKAIRALQQQAEMGSSNYLDSFAMAIRHEGRIELDLFRSVYTEPGRVVRILGEQPGKERDVMLNQPFVRNAQGQPQPAPTGAKAFLEKMKAKVTGQALPEPEFYDMTAGGDEGIVVDVGPSYRTQREENIAFLQGLIEADPNLAPLLADIMAEEMGGPMARKVAKRLRLVNPALKDDDEDSQIPPEAQAKIAALEQQLQEVTQAAQQMQQVIQTKQIETQGRTEGAVQVAQIKEQGNIARLEAQFNLGRQKVRDDIEAQMVILRETMAGDERLAEFEAAMEKALQDDEQRHEIELAKLKGAMAAQQADREALRADASEARDADRTDWRDAQSATRAAKEREEARKDREKEREFEATESEAERKARLALAAKKPAPKKP